MTTETTTKSATMVRMIPMLHLKRVHLERESVWNTWRSMTSIKWIPYNQCRHLRPLVSLLLRPRASKALRCFNFTVILLYGRQSYDKYCLVGCIIPIFYTSISFPGPACSSALGEGVLWPCVSCRQKHRPLVSRAATGLTSSPFNNYQIPILIISTLCFTYDDFGWRMGNVPRCIPLWRKIFRLRIINRKIVD